MKINDRPVRKTSSPGFPLIIPAVLLYLILLFLLAKPFIGWLLSAKADSDGLTSALRFDGNNPTYHYFLGRHYHLNPAEHDTAKAITHYAKSIKLSPLQPGAWIDISKAYQMQGQPDEAEYTLERAVRISPNNPNVMWEAGTFWLINNSVDKAVSVLRQYLLIVPDRQKDVYDLCWKLRLDNSYILANLVPDSYEYQSKYLLYLISTKRVNETLQVWSALNKNSLEKNVFIAYVNALINSSQYDRAAAAWKEITKRIDRFGETDESSLVWNSTFEKEILNGGFDWVISEKEGVDVFLDDTIRMTGTRSIGVNFDGKHNPDITIIQQVVMVKPGTRYTLRGYIKTSSLTTTNGIFLSLQGHNCSMPYRKSEAVTGTSFWRELSVDFETPDGCNAIIIKARREKSVKLDNKIEGTAWIDGITLKQQTDLLKSSSKKP